MPIDTLGKLVSKAAMALDGLHVLAGTHRGELLWIDLESRQTVVFDELSDPITSVAVFGNGRVIAVATYSGHIYMSGNLHRPFIELTPSRPSGVADVWFSRDGERLVSAGRDGLIAVWDLTTAKRLREFAGHRLPATAARFLADGNRIISAGLDGTVRIWDIDSGREEWRGEFGLFGVNTVDVSTDGVTAAWGGGNYKIVVWDLERQEKKFEIAAPASTTFHLAFSPDGNTLAAAGNEPTIRRYDARTGVEQKGLEVGRP